MNQEVEFQSVLAWWKNTYHAYTLAYTSEKQQGFFPLASFLLLYLMEYWANECKMK